MNKGRQKEAKENHDKETQVRLTETKIPKKEAGRKTKRKGLSKY